MTQLWQETVIKDRDPELEEINRLALERIRYFSRRLEENYGLYFKAGAELEFFPLDAAGRVTFFTPDQQKALNRIPTLYKARSGQECEEGKPPESLLRGSFIERQYAEREKDAHEYVLGWVPAGTAAANPADDCQWRSPERIARQLDSTKKRFGRAEVINPLGVAKVTFSNFVNADTASQQITMSLLDRHGRNVLNVHHDGYPLDYGSSILDAVALGLLDVQRETLLLAANYPASNRQLRQMTERSFYLSEGKTRPRAYSSVSMRFKSRPFTSPSGAAKHYTDRYIENLLPRADSNPYLAVLQTVTGIYHGLAVHTSEVKEYSSRHLDERIAELPDGRVWKAKLRDHGMTGEPLQDFSISHDTFTHSTLARELLGNELHGAAGRFYSPDAIRERESRQGAGAALAAR